MSLINRMLRELDKRHAAGAASTAQAGKIAQQVHPVLERKALSDVFWYTMAVLMVIAAGWVAWLIWQLTPRPLVTELAYQSLHRRAAPTAAATGIPAQASASAVRPAEPASPPASAVAPAQTAAVPQSPPVTSAAEASEAPSADVLKLATELTTPIRQRLESERRTRPVAKAPAPRAAGSETDSGALALLRREAPAAASSASDRAAQEINQSGRISRRSATPRERADAEFRSAVALVNQGRIAEGMDRLQASLRDDPGYEAPRQTLVALLLEAKRVDEAARLLRDGLALDPKNTGFAMLLARIRVDRGDVAGALDLLHSHPPAPGTNAEYHAFVAALYQRLGRHAEAVDEYRTALKLSSATGAWWVGLGISEQALSRTQEARDAYQRAKASGDLSPELAGFVDQRLRELH